MPLKDILKEKQIIYRGEDVENQLLFVVGDFNNRTGLWHNKRI